MDPTMQSPRRLPLPAAFDLEVPSGLHFYPIKTWVGSVSQGNTPQLAFEALLRHATQGVALRSSNGGLGAILKRISGVACLSLSLFFSLPATAGDYAVDYAFDGVEATETGRAECEYRSYCRVDFEKAGVSLSLGFRDSHHTSIGIAVYGLRRANCCFFFDGVSSVSRDLSGRSLIRLHVYEGHRRRGNEYIQNAPIGVLSLHISK